LRPRLVESFAIELAEQRSALSVGAVCGSRSTAGRRLFPAGYRIPGALHSSVRNKRVAIDVMNAVSAVRGGDSGALLEDVGNFP